MKGRISVPRVVRQVKTYFRNNDYLNTLCIGDRVTVWKDSPGRDYHSGGAHSGTVTKIIRGKDKVNCASWKEVWNNKVTVTVNKWEVPDRKCGWRVDRFNPETDDHGTDPREDPEDLDDPRLIRVWDYGL